MKYRITFITTIFQFFWKRNKIYLGDLKVYGIVREEPELNVKMKKLSQNRMTFYRNKLSISNRITFKDVLFLKKYYLTI